MTRIPDLGPRGEGWVVLQFLLFVAIGVVAGFAEPWDDGLAPTLRALGTLAISAGFLLLAMAFPKLGISTTAFPKPVEHGQLRTDGIYGLVRHPIYGGVFLLALGWSFLRGPIALVPTVALAVLFVLKSMREEAFLIERYPDYARYRERVRKRFIPGIV
ncbi:MAG: methyltransferase family protein [Actinomycetota bacterium]